MTRPSYCGTVIVAVALWMCGCGAVMAAAGSGYSAAGSYNLANAYARAGKPGMAVLYYERARLLTPDDPDIEANLRHVRDSLHLPSEPQGWITQVATVGGPTTLSWLGLVGFSMVGISIVTGRRYARHRWTRRTVSVLGVALLSLTVLNGMLLWPRMHEAVVVAGPTAVRVSPVPMGDALFALPEASTVSATVEHEGFVLIQTASGRTGWVARANLAQVVPRE